MKKILAKLDCMSKQEGQMSLDCSPEFCLILSKGLETGNAPGDSTW